MIIIIAFYLESRANTPEACANIKGLWDPVAEVCETPTETVIFQSLSKPNPVSVIYPENNYSVKLNHVEKIDGFVYFRGQYDVLIQADVGDKAAVYDRGSVYLNMSKFTLLTTKRSGFAYFAAPFVINTAGSGVFTYVGLFSYNFSNHQATHVSSALLGNRIREETLIVEDRSIVKEEVFVQDGLLNVKFKMHGPEQAFSEYPTQPSDVLLQLVALDPNNDKNAQFRRITDTTIAASNASQENKSKTMHPSWDANNDGINDCEFEGSCDHTIDYSIAKPQSKSNAVQAVTATPEMESTNE